MLNDGRSTAGQEGAVNAESAEPQPRGRWWTSSSNQMAGRSLFRFDHPISVIQTSTSTRNPPYAVINNTLGISLDGTTALLRV